MIVNKHITKIVYAVMAVLVIICLFLMVCGKKFISISGVSMEYEDKLFNTEKILNLNILMESEQWNEMLENATEEKYYQCNVEINGQMFYRVGIRPKGNTSLSSIAADPDNNRYSFKLEFDQFVDGQTCFGLDKLILNNNYADATNMKEALIYDMFQYLAADASLYNYAEISVNGDYWGVYTALEAVEESFLIRNYGVEAGELYKPDSMEMGNMKMPEMDFENMTPPTGIGEDAFSPPQFNGEMPKPGQGSPENMWGQNSTDSIKMTPSQDSTMPDMENFKFSDIKGKGGFSMGGNGANLNYSNDELDSYSTIWEGAVSDTTDSDHKKVVKALKNISECTDLEKYMDTDNLVKYMAAHIFSVNADSLSGNMAHNYYLYESDGQLNILPWDYNLSLGGMGGMGNMSGENNATSVVNDAIDMPFSGTEFFDALLTDEKYCSEYYNCLQQLVDDYIFGDRFEEFYTRTRSQIDELVKNDPNALYTYEEYETAADTLYDVVHLRGESINGQLNGTIPSYESQQSDSDTLIDASHIDMSVMGSMDMGGNMDFIRNKQNQSYAETEDSDEAAIAPGLNGEMQDGMTPPQNGEMPEGFDPTKMKGQMPGGMTPPQNGEMPEGFDPSKMEGQMPGGMTPPQNGEIPEGFDPSKMKGQMSGEMTTPQSAMPVENENQNGEESAKDKPSAQFPDGKKPGNIPEMNANQNNSSALRDNLIMYGISAVVMIGGLIFAGLYRRKSRRK